MKVSIISSTKDKAILLLTFISAHCFLSASPVVAAISYGPTMDAFYREACHVMSGVIQCWGLRSDYATDTAQVTPMTINQEPFGDAKPIQVVVGEYHQVILLDNGKVYGQGDNRHGHKVLGVSSTDPTYTYPVPIQLPSDAGPAEDLSDIVEIEAGRGLSCAVNSIRAMKCWGYNTFGASSSITEYDGSTNRTKVKYMALGAQTCVVSFDNYIKCFGIFGMELQAPYDVIAMEMSAIMHVCLLFDKNDDNVMCFGKNDRGQLGLGFTTDDYNYTLSHPIGLGHAKFITVGPRYSCAVLDNNSQKCWGKDAAMLGSSTPGDKLIPEEVIVTSAIDLGDASIIGIHGGQYATFMHLSDNRIYSWGRNIDGILGINDTYTGLTTGNEYGSAKLVKLNTAILSPPASITPFSWNLELVTPGYLKNPPIVDGVQKFITDFSISDREYTIQIFKDDCATQSSGLPLVNTTDTKANGVNALEATFMYNQSTIQSSNLWTSNAIGGEANFCMKLSLYSNDPSNSGILFNFLEAIYKIEVDLTTGFSTAVDIVRTVAGDGGLETIDIDENITVYQCDDSFNELTSPAAPLLTQGDFLQICVETKDNSAFEVGSIKDVSVSQNGTKNFDYVSSFVESYWAKSSCMSINTTAAKCKVKMQLLGDYFTDADPYDLTVTGFVKMDYLGRRRRHLSNDLVDTKVVLNDGHRNEKRRLPTSPQGISMFSMGVSLSGSSAADEKNFELTDKEDDTLLAVGSEDTSNGVAYSSSISMLVILMTCYGYWRICSM